MKYSGNIGTKSLPENISQPGLHQSRFAKFARSRPNRLQAFHFCWFVQRLTARTRSLRWLGE
jgi:hypothetical protein